MSKALEMTRSELVWETRVCTFDAQDWTRIIDWLKSFLTSADAKDFQARRQCGWNVQG